MTLYLIIFLLFSVYITELTSTEIQRNPVIIGRNIYHISLYVFIIHSDKLYHVKNLNYLCEIYISQDLLIIGTFKKHSTNKPFTKLFLNTKVIRDFLIIVHGDAGSQIQLKLNKTSSPHFWCSKKSDWFTNWLSLEELLPEVLDCFTDNMR